MRSSKNQLDESRWHSVSNLRGTVFQPVLVRYAISLALTALVVSLQWAVDISFGIQAPFFIFFMPLLLIGWFAGLGPSVVSAVFVAVVVQYVPLTPGLVLISEPSAPMRLVVFLLEAFAIGWLAASRRTALIRLERAQESLAHLGAIVRTSDIAIIGKALDGTIISWNRGAEQIYGYRAEEMIGRHVSAFVPSHLQSELIELMDKASRGEHVPQFETMRVRKDGSHIPVSLTISPILDPEGHMTGISAIARDITARKLVEQQLKNSEAEFRAMFELAGVGQGQADPQTGRFTRVNRQLCEITGYSESELLNMTFRDITHPDDLTNDLARYRSVVDGRSSHWFSEKRYVRKDGRNIHVLVSGTLVRGTDGQPWRTTAVIQDVTARKHVMHALLESEERFRVAADTAPVMIWMRNDRGASTFCNTTYAEFVGCAPDAILHHDWMDSVHLNDLKTCRETFCSALSQRTAYQMEYRLRRADGEFRWVMESAVPRQAPDGAFDGFIGSCVDITNRKWAEQALRGAFDELEVQVADSRHELQETEHALFSEKRRREQAEEILKKFGM